MRKIVLLYFGIFTLFQMVFVSVSGQKMNLQVGLEVGKYVRNYSYVKQPPFEVVAMGVHQGKFKLYPRISLGTGNFEVKKENFISEINGFYIKPGADFYIGKKENDIHAILSGYFILGRYNYSNDVTIKNPVWGDVRTIEKGTNQYLSGVEFSYGAAGKFHKDFEWKFLLGLRGAVQQNDFSHNALGFIPGFGKTKQNYTASPCASIIVSYRFP